MSQPNSISSDSNFAGNARADATAPSGSRCKPYDYAVHSDFLIHWTGRDLEEKYDRQEPGHEYRAEDGPRWHKDVSSKTDADLAGAYIERLYNILEFGFWMTTQDAGPIPATVTTPGSHTPRVCFTELKVSESRRHAREYGRLGIGVKRPFVLQRMGRPVAYYGFGEDVTKDPLLSACQRDLKDRELLSFFKPMNSSYNLTYDFYAESEWRIVLKQDLLGHGLINPRSTDDRAVQNYFKSLSDTERAKLKYLVPLDGWLSVLIYPSIQVKNAAQRKDSKIRKRIQEIKDDVHDHANRVEDHNWPIEMDLDACRNF